MCIRKDLRLGGRWRVRAIMILKVFFSLLSLYLKKKNKQDFLISHRINFPKIKFEFFLGYDTLIKIDFFISRNISSMDVTVQSLSAFCRPWTQTMNEKYFAYILIYICETPFNLALSSSIPRVLHLSVISVCICRPVSRESQNPGGRGRLDTLCCWSWPRTWSASSQQLQPKIYFYQKYNLFYQVHASLCSRCALT